MTLSARRAIVFGAGGHAKVVIETLRAIGRFEIAGLIADVEGPAQVLGVPVLGGSERLPRVRQDGIEAAFVAVGANHARERLGARLRELGFALPEAVHPAALVSASARIEAGAVVMARACVGPQAGVGALAIINTGAIVEHDNDIGAAAHIAPGAALAGHVTVGARALIGVGSAVHPRIRVGADAVVGVGAAVVADVLEGAVVGGVPARPLRR